jgi:hypothetical protein
VIKEDLVTLFAEFQQGTLSFVSAELWDNQLSPTQKKKTMWCRYGCIGTFVF